MQKVVRNKEKLLEISDVAKKLLSNLWKARYYFYQLLLYLDNTFPT